MYIAICEICIFEAFLCRCNALNEIASSFWAYFLTLIALNKICIGVSEVTSAHLSSKHICTIFMLFIAKYEYITVESVR